VDLIASVCANAPYLPRYLQLFTEYGRLAMEQIYLKPFQVRVASHLYLSVLQMITRFTP